VILPVGIVQVVCTVVISATAGAEGTAFMMIASVTEVQPAAFFAVIVYDPGCRLANVVPA